VPQARIAELSNTEVVDTKLYADFFNVVSDDEDESVATMERRFRIMSLGFNAQVRPVANLQWRRDEPSSFPNDIFTVRISTRDYNTLKLLYDALPVIVDPPPAGTPPPISFVYDSFPSTYVLTGDNVISPNGLWRSRYHGAFQGNPADIGQVGIRVPSSPTGGFARVMYEFPYTNTNTSPPIGVGYWTSASFVTTEHDYYTDFDCTFSMRTINQKRSSPNAWETAWFFFRFNEAGFPAGDSRTNFHHYYMALKSNGHIELGRKDNILTIDEQYFLLVSEPLYTYALNAWNKVRVRCRGSTPAIHIEIWIDDVLKIDTIDNGSLGFQAGAPNTPPIPSSLMNSGVLGFYNEDATVEFSPMTLTDLSS
jgi:hypothetical protein